MLFNSYGFIFVFLPAALLGFHGAARVGRRPAIAFLVLCSLTFYAWWNPPFVLLLAGSIAINFALGRAMMAQARRREKVAGLLLIGGIASNLGLLFFYKYLFPLIEFLGLRSTLPANWAGGVVLPLGISFFTFTQIGYLIDVRSGLAKSHSLLEYVLFVTFFPHLIAGPILHNQEILPQFADTKTYRFRLENLTVGLTMFALGLGKKVLLADPLGHIANPGFANPAALGTFGAWQSALAYSLQLYFDFSGYCDMAIGVARMFGVRFPLNFNSPYKAQSIIDFWQRWHMTLTRYLTLYLYNPIALRVTRRRVARGRSVGRQATRDFSGFTMMVVMPVAITMALAGIWHGAGLQFIVFGLLHAAYLCINHAWRIFGPRPARGAAKRWLGAPARVLLTYLAALFAQIFFRAASVHDAASLIGGMAGLHPVADAIVLPARLFGWARGMLLPALRHGFVRFGPEAHDLKAWTRIATGFAIVWTLPNTQEILSEFGPALAQVRPAAPRILTWRPDARWGVAVALLLVICFFNLDNVTRFLYFQF